MTQITCPSCGMVIQDIVDGSDDVQYTQERCPYCDHDPNIANR